MMAPMPRVMRLTGPSERLSSVLPYLVGLFGENREGFGCQESRHRVGVNLQLGIVGLMGRLAAGC